MNDKVRGEDGERSIRKEVIRELLMGSLILYKKSGYRL